MQFEYGLFPDGFAVDVESGIWVTTLVSNRLVRVCADGGIETVVAEVNDEFVDAVETAFAAGTMASQHLGRIPNTTCSTSRACHSAITIDGPSSLVAARRVRPSVPKPHPRRAGSLQRDSDLTSRQGFPSRHCSSRLMISRLVRARCFACLATASRQSPRRIASTTARCSRLDVSSAGRSRTVVKRARWP